MEPQQPPQGQHPLNDPNNWNKPKTWVVPLLITILVDDPKLYDEQMTGVVKNLVNELRSIATNFDKSGKQLTFTSLPVIKDLEKIEDLKQGNPLDNIPANLIEDLVNKALKKKEEEGKK